MSTVIPEQEDVFYTIGLLHSSGFSDWKAYDTVNKQILEYCQNAGIPVKQYLPHYETQADWIKHYGSKWTNFLQSKTKFDPKKILSPGQRIFNDQ